MLCLGTVVLLGYAHAGDIGGEFLRGDIGRRGRRSVRQRVVSSIRSVESYATDVDGLAGADVLNGIILRLYYHSKPRRLS